MEVTVISKREKIVYVLLLDEEDGQELQRLLAVREETSVGHRKLGAYPLYEVRKRKLKTSFKLVLRGGRGEMWLAHWVAERREGRPLEVGEKVILSDGNPCNLQRNNIVIFAPKGVWKNGDVAWVVRIKGAAYICVRKEDGGEKKYIRCGGRDPEEVRQEWLVAA